MTKRARFSGVIGRTKLVFHHSEQDGGASVYTAR